MFKDAFIKLEQNERAQVLEEVNPALTGNDFDAGKVTVLGQDLSFYPGYRFLDIADYDTTPPFRKFVIHKPGDVAVLDWTNGPVYALNERVPLGLTPSTIIDYVRFFFAYVRGPHGKMILAECVDDIEWRDEPPPAARKALGKMLMPATVSGRTEDGGWMLSVTVIFKAALYKATLVVSRAGQISTKDEELLVDDLPVTDDTLGQ